jgi:predicted dehydrogenase
VDHEETNVMADQLRAAIIGSGFMASVHAHAIRAAGADLVGLVGSSPESGNRAADRLGAHRGMPTVDALVSDSDVDVVHICTPNNTHHDLAHAALSAGKHVICEKPLATSVVDAAALVDAARTHEAIATVPFVYRFYPLVREARTRVADGETGRLHFLHGSYLQDWLADEDDHNWRVDEVVGGPSRAFADIGIHWCDLMEYVTGHRITRLFATMAAVLPRNGSGELPGTEDVAMLLFETNEGAVGTCHVSQVSWGRKNRLRFSFDGTAASFSFDQETPETLVVGRRDGTLALTRDPDTLSAPARRYSHLPAGHPQGYQACFNDFVADTYAAVRGDDPPGLPTFEDGLRAAVLTEAALTSARENHWVEVPA